MEKKKVSLNLKQKLILCFVLVTVTVIAATVLPALYLFSGAMDNENKERAKQGMQGLYSVLEGYKQDALNNGEVFAANTEVIDAVAAADTTRVLALLRLIAAKVKVDFVTVTDSKGVVIARTHAPNKFGDNVANQYNVRNALRGTAFSAIETGTVVKLSARAGIPVKNAQGEVIGVISTGYNVTNNNNIVDQVKKLFHTESTIFMGDERVSTTIIQDGKRLIGTKLNQQIAELVLKKGETYIGSAQIMGINYITAYMPLMGPDNTPIGILFSGQKTNEAEKVENNLLYTVLAITLIVMVLSFLLANVIAKKISQPIKYLAEAAGKVADGDLTHQVEVKSSDEVGMLAIAFNRMIEQLKTLITKVNGLATSVAASSEELTASADQSAQAANQTSISITELAHGTDNQLNSINNALIIVEDIAGKIKDIAGKSKNVADSSDKTFTAAQKGKEAVESVIKQMTTIEINVTDTAAKISKLGESSREIGQFVDKITGIAGQTNLLALNAAVEAARAGENGRGFAVVADEIRQLAEQAEKTSKGIAVKIREIQSETLEAVQSMQEGTKQVTAGCGAVDLAGQEFSEIIQLVERVAAQIIEISNEISQIAKGNQQIVVSIRGIGDIGKGAANEAQTVSAATQEQSASMQEIASASQALADMANELQAAITVFKI